MMIPLSSWLFEGAHRFTACQNRAPGDGGANEGSGKKMEELPSGEGAKPPVSPPKQWNSSISASLPLTVTESTETAVHSTVNLHDKSLIHLRHLQDLMADVKVKFIKYEDVFFRKAKDQLLSAREQPDKVVGFAVAAGFLLMRGPRRFLVRHTLGRLLSEEAQFVRAEKTVREFNLSVDLIKKESKKLLERAALAEKEMRHGQAELMNSGNHIRHLANSIYRVEDQAADLLNGLRKIPGREALHLRAEAASLASLLEQRRTSLNRRMITLSDLKIPV
ncbi:hypothetical protein Nepgr_013383 [Nepenthes gracilis]|uniref:RGS1-HXK1-interacting protein 1 n=1 Tax=Nepenthes gracilis TaxID=150966 RepID=A0AAD3SI07_NEPGR|nr:hypothetical protein Nepgr_013383 [Nepenthes gracilis]